MPYELFSPQLKEEQVVCNLAPALEEVHQQEEERQEDLGVLTTVSSTLLQPVSLQEDSVELLEDAFKFHRDRAWLLKGIDK